MQTEQENVKEITITETSTIAQKLVGAILLGGVLSFFASMGLLLHANTQINEIRDDVEQIRETLEKANERIEQYIAQNSLSTMDDLQKLDNIDED